MNIGRAVSSVRRPTPVGREAAAEPVATATSSTTTMRPLQSVLASASRSLENAITTTNSEGRRLCDSTIDHREDQGNAVLTGFFEASNLPERLRGDKRVATERISLARWFALWYKRAPDD